MFIHGEYNIVQMSIILKLFTCLWLISHQQMSGSPVYTRHQVRHWERTEGKVHLKIRCQKKPSYCQSWDVPEVATRLRFLLASYWRFQEKGELWCEASSLRSQRKKTQALSGVRKDPCVNSAWCLSPWNKARVPPPEAYLYTSARKPSGSGQKCSLWLLLTSSGACGFGQR